MIRFGVLLVLVGSLVVASSEGSAVEPEPVKKPTPLLGLDLVKHLQEQLKSGTPLEKEAALDLIRELKPIRLIPGPKRLCQNLPRHSA